MSDDLVFCFLVDHSTQCLVLFFLHNMCWPFFVFVLFLDNVDQLRWFVFHRRRGAFGLLKLCGTVISLRNKCIHRHDRHRPHHRRHRRNKSIQVAVIVLVPASQASTRICQFEHTRPWCLGHSEIEMGSPSHNQHQCHIGMVLDYSYLNRVLILMKGEIFAQNWFLHIL